jgi:D-alanine--poly(phosphoribitol) ligase subunit 2
MHSLLAASLWWYWLGLPAASSDAQRALQPLRGSARVELILEDRIKAYLEESLLIEFDDDLTPDTDLFKEGAMDSFAYLELFGFLRREFGVEVSVDELASNVLVNLSGICAFVAARSSEQAAPMARVASSSSPPPFWDPHGEASN